MKYKPEPICFRLAETPGFFHHQMHGCLLLLKLTFAIVQCVRHLAGH